jgi:hypothetical protein
MKAQEQKKPDLKTRQAAAGHHFYLSSNASQFIPLAA